MLPLADTVSAMESAEDLFRAYGVSFDPRVLAVHRLHILRRFGRALVALGASRGRAFADPENDRSLIAAALAEAHAHFSAGGAPDIAGIGWHRDALVQIRSRAGGSSR